MSSVKPVSIGRCGSGTNSHEASVFHGCRIWGILYDPGKRLWVVVIDTARYLPVSLSALGSCTAGPILSTFHERLYALLYRIEIGILPFMVAGILALLIAIFTVGYHAIRAATADPVESLRYE